MLKNNFYALLFHVVWSIICFFIYPPIEEGTSFFVSIIYYVLFLCPYFFFSFVLHKHFKYYKSKLMNLLSFLSIFGISVLLGFFDFFMSNYISYGYIISGMLFVLYHSPAYPMNTILVDILGIKTEMWPFIFFMIPTMLCLWLGIEFRKKLERGETAI